MKFQKVPFIKSITTCCYHFLPLFYSVRVDFLSLLSLNSAYRDSSMIFLHSNSQFLNQQFFSCMINANYSFQCVLHLLSMHLICYHNSYFLSLLRFP